VPLAVPPVPNNITQDPVGVRPSEQASRRLWTPVSITAPSAHGAHLPAPLPTSHSPNKPFKLLTSHFSLPTFHFPPPSDPCPIGTPHTSPEQRSGNTARARRSVGTPHTYTRPIHHVTVNHGGAHVVVAQQFLQSPDISAILQRERRNRMPQRVTPPLAQNTTTPGRLSEKASNPILVHLPADQAPGKIPTARRTASHPSATAPSPSILPNTSSRDRAGLSPGTSATPKHHGRSLPIPLIPLS
jgi:hypothetical protein